MKRIIQSLLIFALLNGPAFGQVILPTRISGSFSVSEWLMSPYEEISTYNPDFPNGVNVSFSFTVDVPQLGAFEAPAVPLDSWTPDPFTIGKSNLTRSDVGAFVEFQDGVLQFFFIGGLLDGVNGIGMQPPGAAQSDFMFIYAPLQNEAGFLYQIDGWFAQGGGENVQASIDVATAQPIPEASSVGIGGALFLLAFVIRSQIVRRTRC